ncbi:MAG TPA: arylesterase [Beijerinckiaceae bacterium]|nr:arylesterase [Beijerinckiaceae bacterium]
MKRQSGSVVAVCLAAGLALAATQAQAAPLQIVALGDSLTAGYGLPQDAAFPAVLERELRKRGHDVRITNAGVSGDTASGGLDRLDWAVPDGTDGVIVALGANDMLRGVDPAVTRRALESIVTRLKERKIPVMLAGMFAARNLGPDYVQRFDSIYPDLAQSHGLVLYPFFLEGIAGDPKLNLPDRVHPSAPGVERMVANILPTVERFLAGLKG